ncbi:hypothetical protein HPB51_026073 [Rhipicephalus microplus]|uniref:Tudor domain-containing protein n=1 Tax=Rhipicephalus microplus TaxID=6941 RepID=A0A9J6EE43_RHIMP|nr:hypothetical protein HPB51_026073 [Rhipicephalus microplus]
MSKLPLQRRYRSPEVPLHQKALVSIMHIESPTDFFVHFNDRQGALETLTQELQEVPENENTSVDLSQPCMAYWSDDLPYRITVLKDKGEAEGASSVPVKFVDYGNTDTVERAGIRELPDALLSEPLFAINCTLDVPEDKLGVEALDKLKVLADEGPTSSLLAEFLGERNGRYVVRLLDMGIDILEKLQGAVHDASRGGSSDVTANSHNESVFKEGTSEGPESVPKAPIVEGENKQNDQVSTDPFSDSVSVSEPPQFSEIEACQGMSDKETGGFLLKQSLKNKKGRQTEHQMKLPRTCRAAKNCPKKTHSQNQSAMTQVCE